jgi:hypothetical protein
MSTGSDDDVQIVEKPWEEAVLAQEEYKTRRARHCLRRLPYRIRHASRHLSHHHRMVQDSKTIVLASARRGQIGIGPLPSRQVRREAIHLVDTLLTELKKLDD